MADEMLADFTGSEAFSSPRFVERLLQEPPSLLQKIITFIRDLRTRLTGTQHEKELLHLQKQLIYNPVWID